MDTTHPHNSADAEDKDLMKIVAGYPPNFELIKAALPMAADIHTYCYGDTIYNPSGATLTIDRQFHEFIHSQRQLEVGVDAWWYSYLTDRRFRLDEEIKAYGEQYAYARRFTAPEKFFKWLRGNMSEALSGEAYGSLIDYARAESAIRNYGKK